MTFYLSLSITILTYTNARFGLTQTAEHYKASQRQDLSRLLSVNVLQSVEVHNTQLTLEPPLCAGLRFFTAVRSGQRGA